MPEYAPVKKKKVSKREKCGEIAYDAWKLGRVLIIVLPSDQPRGSRCSGEKTWRTTLIITTPDAIIRALIIKFRRLTQKPVMSSEARSA